MMELPSSFVFMLILFWMAPLLGVLDDLKRAGYAFETEWFQAQYEFRFPLAGRVEHGGVTLEIPFTLKHPAHENQSPDR